MLQYILNNGVKMPPIGYGTYKTPDGAVCVEGVKHALKTGYRLIDTAYFYANERSVKEGIIDSKISHNDIFLTTKLWNTGHGYDNALRAFDVSENNLGKNAVDLFLIHWPVPLAHRDDWTKVLPDTWRALERLYKDGRVRAIGVCNCLPHHLDVIAQSATVLPMVNQIEFHIGYTQNETVEYCKNNNIAVEAWAPLARAKAFDTPEVRKVVCSSGKTAAQVLVRYCIQKGVIPLPKSVNSSRIEENFDVFGFELNSGEMAQLDGITDVGRLGSHPDELKF